MNFHQFGHACSLSKTSDQFIVAEVNNRNLTQWTSADFIIRMIIKEFGWISMDCRWIFCWMLCFSLNQEVISILWWEKGLMFWKKKALKGTKRQWSVYIQCVLNSIIELNFQCRIGSEIVRILSLVAFDMCFVIDICFVQIVW